MKNQKNTHGYWNPPMVPQWTYPPIPPADIYFPTVAQKGWVCPLCNKVWAPNVVGCFNCNKDKCNYSTGTDSSDIKAE